MSKYTRILLVCLVGVLLLSLLASAKNLQVGTRNAEFSNLENESDIDEVDLDDDEEVDEDLEDVEDDLDDDDIDEDDEEADEDNLEDNEDDEDDEDEDNLSPEQQELVEEWLVDIKNKNEALSEEELEEIKDELSMALSQCNNLDAEQCEQVLAKIKEMIQNGETEDINANSFENLSRTMLRLRILAKQENLNFADELAKELDSGNVFNGEKQNPGLALGHYKNDKEKEKPNQGKKPEKVDKQNGKK